MSLVLSPLVIPKHDAADYADDTSMMHSVDSVPFLLDEASFFKNDGEQSSNDKPSSSTVADEEQQPVQDNHDSIDTIDMEEDDEAASQPQQQQQQQKPQYGGGLVNLGNTCYMNAAIQALASLNGLPETLEAQHDADNTNSELTMALQNLLQSLQNNTTTNPSDFKQLMDSKTSLFAGYRQQDSHEFITTLIDLLDEEYKQSIQSCTTTEDDDMDCTADEEETTTAAEALSSSSPPPSPPRIESFSRLQVDEIGQLLHGTTRKRGSLSESAAAQPIVATPQCKLVGGQQQHVMHDSSACHLLQHATLSEQEQEDTTETTTTEEDRKNDDDTDTPSSTTPMDDLFTTRIKVSLRCDSCNYTRHSIETHRHLSLDIDNGDGCTSNVEEAIQKFIAPQSLEIKCEECFAERATQTSEILSFPKALLLHFKRFILQKGTWRYVKNAARVDFDESLQLESLQNYNLKAVVHHVGSSVHCGHYTTDALRQGEWKRFNDNYISDTKDVSKTTAYMVLYERV